MQKTFFVRAEWDQEAEVWVATSDDVPGLVTEAETLEILSTKLNRTIPELLNANGVVPQGVVATGETINHPHPGTILREEVLKPLNLTVGEVANRLGMSRASISRVTNGRCAISYDLAIRLEAAGVSTARFWVELQRVYDLEKARQAAGTTLSKIIPLVPNKVTQQCRSLRGDEAEAEAIGFGEAAASVIKGWE